jgi:hypothetical protein
MAISDGKAIQSVTNCRRFDWISHFEARPVEKVPTKLRSDAKASVRRRNDHLSKNKQLRDKSAMMDEGRLNEFDHPAKNAWSEANVRE